MSVRITGINELRIGLQKKMNLDAVKRVVKKNGADLQSKMVREAEFDKGYQTGTTKRSIGLEVSDGGLTSTVEPGTEYSPYLEYGTRFMEAQPFVSPAFNTQKEKFKNDMDKLVK